MTVFLLGWRLKIIINRQAMAKYRPIKTSFWEDDWIASLTTNEKLLFLYLLTNPHTNLCGIYRVSIRYLSFETGIEKDQIIKCLERFSKDEKVEYLDGWIILKNHQKHQTASPKIKQGIEREMSEIPQEIANYRYPIDTLSIATDKPVLKLEPKLEPNISTNVDVDKQDFKHFIAFYEDTWGVKLRSLDRRAIKYRVRRKNFSAEEIIQAAKGVRADKFLQGDNKDGKVYGDIDYILRSDEQIEKYLSPVKASAGLTEIERDFKSMNMFQFTKKYSDEDYQKMYSKSP